MRPLEWVGGTYVVVLIAILVVAIVHAIQGRRYGVFKSWRPKNAVLRETLRFVLLPVYFWLMLVLRIIEGAHDGLGVFFREDLNRYFQD